ncbi:MAG: RNase adapter RapZ [Thermohalobaculum sp.]|nr:RNase adapter RapZ [Thermohalobaculum sp.]
MTGPGTAAARLPGATRLAPGMVIVTGMSGAGRTTAIHALEDMGFEVLDNFPIGLLDMLIEPGGGGQPVALGVETRTRGFSVHAVAAALDMLRARLTAPPLLIFLDCADAVLVRRFSETRRRHPLAPAEDPAMGVARERDLLTDIRATADMVIDTSALTPHDLRREIEARFSPDRARRMTVGLSSFSYKRGAPGGAEMVLDCRFLRNPYWDETLRALDGRDPAIQGYVGADPRFGAFLDQLTEMVLMLLPAYLDEGKVFFSVALGCTGGQHRSVAVAEMLARRLEAAGWPASVRHLELERRR